MRFEFLTEQQSLALPRLSSDAFTMWGKHSDPVHDQNATAASKDLCTRVVPRLARLLTDEYTKDRFDLDQALDVFVEYNPDLARCVAEVKRKWSREASEPRFDGRTFWDKVQFELQDLWWDERKGSNPMDCPIPPELDKMHNILIRDLDLSSWFHREGVNMRHIVLVRQHLQVGALRTRLLEDAIVRSLKAMLRGTMREAGAGAKDAVASLIQKVLATTPESHTLWSTSLPGEMRSRFGELILDGLPPDQGDLRLHVSRPLATLMQDACRGAPVLTPPLQDLSVVVASDLELSVRANGVSFTEVVSARSQCREAEARAEAGDWKAATGLLQDAERRCHLIKRSDPANAQVHL